MICIRYFLCLGMAYLGVAMSACTAPAATPPITKESGPTKVEINSDLTLLHKMQGRWLDVKNEESVIEVNGERFWSIYQDEVMKIHRLEVFDQFPDQCGGKPSLGGLGFFITWGPDGSSYCYQLLDLSHGKMHYEALGPVKE